ncbi:hypothetical protein [Exiguobacterium sp. s163]|uniref:hypothetical protein n=1 Tax=Exiguobacterium sp. s163 TaxID=2751287 RepID=UPI001BE9223D|nr:hypothetical protein [Exiguobacterium sp. s163]
MGSFHVACLVTGLQIRSEEDAMFLPMKRSHRTYREKNKKNFEAPIVSSTADEQYLFEPYLLPIKGQYDSYGRLKDIQRDDNVEKIEQTFGLAIKDFIDVVTCNRNYGSRFSEMNKHLMAEEMKEVVFNPLSFSSSLTALGFTSQSEEGETRYTHKECGFHISVSVSNETESDECVVTYRDGSYKTIRKKEFGQIVDIAIHEDNYFLGIDEANQSIARELHALSGGFINPRIYERLSGDGKVPFGKVTLSEGRPSFAFYSDDKETFAARLFALQTFVNNLSRSNRILKPSISISEWNTSSRVELQLGLVETIIEEIDKLGVKQ